MFRAAQGVALHALPLVDGPDVHARLALEQRRFERRVVDGVAVHLVRLGVAALDADAAGRVALAHLYGEGAFGVRVERPERSPVEREEANAHGLFVNLPIAGFAPGIAERNTRQ